MSRKALYLGMAWAMMATGSALGFVIDGNLWDDWGVRIADNNASTYNFLSTIKLVGYHVEDQDDNAGDSGWLGPHAGGQNYDGEMMAVAIENNTLYLALVTGQRPDNGLQRFSPGDIRIETTLGSLGLEVGGGQGGLTSSFLTEGMPGSTYKLDSNGYTKQHKPTAAAQTVGSVWSDVKWLEAPIEPYQPVQFEINPGHSTLLGMADYAYTLDSVTKQHAIIELAFDLTPLHGQTLNSIHWRPGCGNDELDVLVDMPLPEPSAALAMVLLAGLGLRKRRTTCPEPGTGLATAGASRTI